MGRVRPTGHDVARAAGVSQATVSLVFSGAAGRVSEATAQRVRSAARHLGYQPIASGRNLRKGTSGLVLLALPSLPSPYFARVLDGAQRAATERGMAVIGCSAWAGDQLSRLAESTQFDGMILCSPLDDQLHRMAPAPTVLLDADPSLARPTLPVVALDVAVGIREVMKHVQSRFGGPVGYLHYDRPAHTYRARQAAARMSAVGPLTEIQLPSEVRSDRAAAAAREALANPADRPRVIVCDDDLAAAAVYRAASDLGLRIPDDLAVAGMDNNELSGFLTPPLTTVDLHGEELGRVGVATMAALIESSVAASAVITPTLVARRSTGSASRPDFVGETGTRRT